MTGWTSLAATLVVGVGLGTGATFIVLQHHQAGVGSHRHYAGQNKRLISTLSARDVSSLKNGEGWGLAKPAEFNGYPGPRHVLDAATELHLSEKQREAIQAIFDKMNAGARQLGQDYIEAEAALDAVFAQNAADETKLRTALAGTERLRSQLRAIHLAAHLETEPLLSATQKKKYAELRGYGSHAHH